MSYENGPNYRNVIDRVRSSTTLRLVGAGGLSTLAISGGAVVAHSSESQPAEQAINLEAGILREQNFLSSPTTVEGLGVLSISKTEASKPSKREIPQSYRCDGKDGQPIPGWEWCPKKRGNDIVPDGGWTVAPLDFAHRFVSASKQVLVQSLRRPIPNNYMNYGPYGSKLSYYIPFDPKYGFAKPVSDNYIGFAIRDFWYQVNKCESRDNWTNTSGYYRGGLQTDKGFEDNYAEDLQRAYSEYKHDYSIRSSDTTKEEQIVMAERGHMVQGDGAWPACTAYLASIGVHHP